MNIQTDPSPHFMQHSIKISFKKIITFTATIKHYSSEQSLIASCVSLFSPVENEEYSHLF